MKMVRLFGIALMMLLVSTVAWSADLNGKDVKSFVNSMRDLKPLFDQYAEETGDDGDATSTAQVVQDWSKGMKGRSELESVLKKNGFTYESWEQVSMQVMHAYMAVKFGKDGKNVVGQMEESRQAIQDSKDLPAESKQQLIEEMTKSIAEFKKSLDASKTDQEAVRPFITDLDAIFDWQE